MGLWKGNLEKRSGQRKRQGQLSIKVCAITSDILKVNQYIALIQLKEHNLSNKIYHAFGLNHSSPSTSTVLNWPHIEESRGIHANLRAISEYLEIERKVSCPLKSKNKDEIQYQARLKQGDDRDRVFHGCAQIAGSVLEKSLQREIKMPSSSP